MKIFNQRRIFCVLCLYASLLLAQWEPDMRLTNASGHSRMGDNNARTIVAEGDTIHVVWMDQRDGNSEIYYKRSLDGGDSWDMDTRLTDNQYVSALPALAVNGLMLHVAWYDTRDSGNFEIYYKRSQDGGITWEPDVRLTFDYEYSWYPSLVLTNTNVHVVWRESRAGNYEIFYKRSTDEGSTWGADTNLSNAAGSSETPSIAQAGSTLHVLWFDNRDGGAYEIYYKRSLDEGVTWEPDVRLTDDPGVSFGPSVAVRGVNVHVAWQDSRDGNWEIYYNKSTDNGTTWGSDIRLTSAAETSESPSIVASGSNVHVVWWDNRDGNYEIYYKRSTDEGLTWEPDTRLTTDSSWSQFPQIALQDSILHVIWEDGRIAFDNNELFYKRNRTGNPGIEENYSSITKPSTFSVASFFKNDITINFAILPSEELTITLYDVSGVPVLERNCTSRPRTLVLSGKSIQHIPAAVYFLIIRAGGKKLGYAKLIKIK